MKYYIDGHTGAGNEYVEGTLDDAIKTAENGACYTQCDITIHEDNENGKIVATWKWWGVKYDEAENDSSTQTIDFGDYGYFELVIN